MVKRWSPDVTYVTGECFPYMIRDSQGEYVEYDDYAALEAESARLKEALRNMMEATEAVDEWKSGEAPSFLGGYAFDLVKVARKKAREVLGDDKKEA